MIEAIITGKLHQKAEERTSKAGNLYVQCRMRVSAGEDVSVLVTVRAFDEIPARALLAVAEGDALAVAGTYKPSAWIDRDGNARPGGDLIAGQVMSLYGLARRRKAAAGEPEHQQEGQQAHQQHQERRQGPQAPQHRQQDPVQRDLGDIGPQDWPSDSGAEGKAPWEA